MQLREYQQQAISKVLESRTKTNKQVLVLATGTGKTIIFNHLISLLIKETGKKALIIAHREELLTQAKDKMAKVDSTLRVGIEQATNHADEEDYDVIVASVPTIGKNNSDRILKYNPTHFCVVITDECHHASNETYKAIFRHFGVMKGEPSNDWNKSCLLLGVTATPSRNDNRGIDQIFDKLTFTYEILDGIQDRFLARIKAFKIRTFTDLTHVKKTAGDFNLGELGQAVNTEDRNGLIVKTYKSLIPNKQALCFAVNVSHAEELYRRFREEGVKSGWIVGTTPKEDRRELLRQFHNKDIQVMVNALVLTEGYDNETIEAILMARPTQSGILFQQMVGRGTRIHPDKKYLTVIDFVDNTFRQNLQTVASLIGIPGAVDFQGHDIISERPKLLKLQELAPDTDFNKVDIDKIEYAIQEVDLLSGINVPEEIKYYTSFEWFRYGQDNYRLSLGNHDYITVRPTITGDFIVSYDTFDQLQRRALMKELSSLPTLREAVRYGDEYIRKNNQQALRLVRQGASWKSDEPTQAQLKLLKKLRVPAFTLQQINKGQASKMISKILSQKKPSKFTTGLAN